MAIRRLTIVIVIAGLLLAGCSLTLLPAAPGTGQPATAIPASESPFSVAPVTPTATAAAPATAQPPSPSPAVPTQAPHPLPPTVGLTSITQPPTPGPDTGTALRAWGIGPDGKFYVLLSTGNVHRLGIDPPVWVGDSGPLFDGGDPGASFMAINDDLLVLSSTTLTRTLVLGRDPFVRRGEITRAGPVALSGSRRLFVLADDAVWAYDLADAAAPPVAVTKWPVDPFTPRPRNLAVDEQGRQLIVTLHDVSASPPHQQEWYVSYDLDSLQQASVFAGQLGELTPASAGGGQIVGGVAAKNGFLGSKVAVFDRQGREVRAAQPFAGRPIVDARGEWIYVLGPRGTWVLRASDLSLVGFDPYPGNAPDTLSLSVDESKLYEIGDGQVEVKETSALRDAGIAPLHGYLPPTWFDSALTDFLRPRFYPVPGSAGTAYVEVGGYGETWRTRDGGKTWRMLPGLVYPNFHYVTHLSISPDFSQDQTIVAAAASPPAFLRSTDGGDTWSAWDPPVAFVSDRDGNREIYTADRGKLGGGPARNLLRRTDEPAADENPAWSPGWTRIAFQSNRNGNWDIFTMRADCDPSEADAETKCDVRQITNDPADDMLPAWSPDGRWIAFVSTRDGSAGIYAVPPGGGQATRLTTSGPGVWRPAWLPDSQRLMFTATRAGGSNDIAMGTIVEGPDGSILMPEAPPIIDSPYDERDAAVGTELFVYLSDETGPQHTYGRYNYDQATSFAFTTGAEPEGHPTLLEDGTNTVLVTLARDGQTGIYRANTSGYEPFVVHGSFNGQPAAGPVPWRPAADWSWERARTWQK